MPTVVRVAQGSVIEGMRSGAFLPLSTPVTGAGRQSPVTVMTVTREDAFRIATQYLATWERKGSDALIEGDAEYEPPRIGKVLTVAELTFREPFVYGLHISLDQCWIAYVERPVTRLGPSEIILIARASGEVVYAGSAGDEG